MKLTGNSVFIATLILLATRPGLAVSSDTFELREVARVPYWSSDRYAIGDADHDGHAEFYALGYVPGEGWVDYILEHRGNWEFDTIQLGWENAMNWDIGDADRDDKTDLIVQIPTLHGHFLSVVESPDHRSLPDSIVWDDSIMYQGTAMFAWIADLDVDSAPEIAVMDYVSGCVRVYENTANNDFSLKTMVPCDTCALVRIAPTHDMDRDGIPELVCGTNTDRVMIYEAVFDDSIELRAVCRLPGGADASAVAAADDFDRDGRPEALAFGVNQDDVGSLGIFESPMDDSFSLVWHQNVGAAYFASYCIAVGDVDGDSIPEFAFTTGLNVYLYRCSGPDSYEEMWHAYTNKVPVGLYDLDGDGRCELLYRYSETTVIMQYVEVSVEELRDRQARSLQVRPSVTRGAPVGVVGIADGAEVEVVDAAGRVVAMPRDGIWNPRGISPGAYFVRVRTGNQAVVQKVLVLR